MSLPNDTVTVKACAAALGVSVRTVQRCVRGQIGPGLPAHNRAGRHVVSLDEARRYLEMHSRADLRPAPGAALGSADELAVQLASQIPTDPDAVLRTLATSPALVEQLGNVRARVMVAAAEAHRKAREAETKAAGLLTPDDFTKGLRAAMELFVGHVEEIGARRCASKLVAFIRKTFNVDLVNCHPSAVALLERELREDHNCSLAEFRQEIADRMRGVRMLHGFQTGPALPTEGQPGGAAPIPATDGEPTK
jgi:hypothetical protein